MKKNWIKTKKLVKEKQVKTIAEQSPPFNLILWKQMLINKLKYTVFVISWQFRLHYVLNYKLLSTLID